MRGRATVALGGGCCRAASALAYTLRGFGRQRLRDAEACAELGKLKNRIHKALKTKPPGLTSAQAVAE
jgi:hypothetical protein